MKIRIERSFTVSGKTVPELEEAISQKVDEFLGNREGHVEVWISPMAEDHTLLGTPEVVVWECNLEVILYE